MSERAGIVLRLLNRLVLVSAALLTVASVPAASAAPAGDARIKGVFATCAACHGERAEGKVALQAPALTALGPAYIERQLQAFASGRRGAHAKDTYGAQMAAAVAQLGGNGVFRQLAAYIDGLPDVVPAATVEGDLKQGHDYYKMICGSCHGPLGEGNVHLQAPALAGIDDWYLLRQLDHYRNGIRGADADDRLGRQMQSMSLTLPDMAVARNVVAYIQSLVKTP